MGNRAVVTFGTAASSPCIYLHWNGGRASIEGFCEAARRLGLVDRWQKTVKDDRRIMDEFARFLARYFYDTEVDRLHVYRERYGEADCDNHDNGVYVLHPNFTIKDRLFWQSGREERDIDKTNAIVAQIMASVAAWVCNPLQPAAHPVEAATDAA